MTTAIALLVLMTFQANGQSSGMILAMDGKATVQRGSTQTGARLARR